MPKRSSNSKPDPLQLTQELHAQIKACDRLPPPWDAYQTDDPPGYHDLSKRIAESLKIPSLGLSRHSIKPDESSERFDFFPDRVWTIEARPSFHSAGKIAVFESRSHVRCAIVCKGNLPDKPDADYVVEELFCAADDWSDPVLPVIDEFQLAPTPDRDKEEGRLMLYSDGISYVFSACTLDAKSIIQFSNPRSGIYRRLARACYTAAKQIAERVSNPQVSNFVKVWKSYAK